MPEICDDYLEWKGDVEVCLFISYDHHRALRLGVSHSSSEQEQERIEVMKNPNQIIALSVLFVVAIVIQFRKTQFNLQEPLQLLREGTVRRGERARVETSAIDLPPFANMSSVDYFPCCGLGHRLSRMADAAYVAKRLNFSLRTFWGRCDHVEVYNHLFEQPQPEDFPHVTNQHEFLRINNGVFATASWHQDTSTRVGKKSCQHDDKLASDFEFYSRLRRQFRMREKVESFRKGNFENFTVLGIHIRAGNGETGGFVVANRGIDNLDIWISNVAQTLIEFTNRTAMAEPPLLFIATDTPSIVRNFSQELEDVMPVKELSQLRKREGEGVQFGQHGMVEESGDACLSGWESVVMDMILLSYADVVIAARYSSMTQSMPLSLALGQTQRNIEHSFCEMDHPGSSMRCYKNIREWYCHPQTSKVFGMESHFRPHKSVIYHPPLDYDWDRLHNLTMPRGKDCKRMRCIPANASILAQ